jgi:hypothetical protein
MMGWTTRSHGRVMMRSFMTLRSLTWGTELSEDLCESDTMRFLGENIVMAVYGGRPHQGDDTCLSSAPGLRLIAIRDTGPQGCNDTSFPISL